MSDNYWEVHLGSDFQAVICHRHAAEMIAELDPAADPGSNYHDEDADISITEDFFGQIENPECWDCEVENA